MWGPPRAVSEERIDKGITLVALVVTIIVLLILAGVSLNLVAGSNGIINKASTAVDEYTMQSAREQAEIDLAQITVDAYMEGRSPTIADLASGLGSKYQIQDQDSTELTATNSDYQGI